jgi:hypothetical protein
MTRDGQTKKKKVNNSLRLSDNHQFQFKEQASPAKIIP